MTGGFFAELPKMGSQILKEISKDIYILHFLAPFFVPITMQKFNEPISIIFKAFYLHNYILYAALPSVKFDGTSSWLLKKIPLKK